jgi:hypothetical protein
VAYHHHDGVIDTRVVDLEREDGWTVLFRGKEAILRVRDEHIQSLDLVDDD